MNYCSLALSGLILMGCGIEDEFEVPQSDCDGFGSHLISLEELKAYYQGETVRIMDSVQWRGYVVSSDATSNLFGEIYLQDEATNASGGLVFLTDLLESHSLVPFGSSVVLNLKGLYLGRSGGSFKLGGGFPSFGNLGVGRLPASLFGAHVTVLCNQEVLPEALRVSIEALSENQLNTLVEIPEVELLPEEVGLPFANTGEQTRRTLQDCSGNSLTLLNSGYSDFHSEALPDGFGSVKGILSNRGSRFELIVMNPSDLRLDQPRCDSRIERKSSDQILISEIADPDNLPEARFIELYNASDSLFRLDGWELRRFTNANLEPGLAVSLDGLEIQAGGVLVFSAYPEVFKNTYGFVPDAIVSRNGPADSNGDDSIELIDPFGNIVDAFGTPGEDGTGTASEFEDGRALRRKGIILASTVFNPSEWVVHNDSGGNGTIADPRNAPEDFSPGLH
ncbi:MAG: DUF5689 domain-containing protein [Robiginitalea sp.]|jgi:hypothetical protein